VIGQSFLQLTTLVKSTLTNSVGIVAIDRYSMGEFVYAVTAAESVILSLFTSNEQ